MPDWMPLLDISDWSERLARQDAFWERKVLDRPVVQIVVQNGPVVPPVSRHATLHAARMDPTYQAELALAMVESRSYYGDALPIARPDLGPAALGAVLGCEVEVNEETCWTVPYLKEWSDKQHVGMADANVYYQALWNITREMLRIGRGRFITGSSSFHPGADAVAALRGSEQLSIDLMDNPREVESLLPTIHDAYMRVFVEFAEFLEAAGQPTTSFVEIVSTKRYHVAADDFSCMISAAMFRNMFLPGIVKRIRSFDASIYHLDGPGALRHLDALLEIPELDAVQWIPGAANGSASDWLDVYERVQNADKGVQVILRLDELDTVLKNVQPEGAWLWIENVPNETAALEALKEIESWGNRS